MPRGRGDTLHYMRLFVCTLEHHSIYRGANLDRRERKEDDHNLFTVVKCYLI